MNYVQKFLSSVIVSVLLSAIIVWNRRKIFRLLSAPQRAQAIYDTLKDYSVEMANTEHRSKEVATAFVAGQRDYFLRMADEQGYSEAVKKGMLQGILTAAQNAVRLELEFRSTRRYGMRLSIFDEKLAAEQFDLLREQLDSRDEVFARMRSEEFPIDELLKQLSQMKPVRG